VKSQAPSTLLVCLLIQLAFQPHLLIHGYVCRTLFAQLTVLGNQTITESEVWESEVVILDGDLVIKSGGSLTLINTTLFVNCSAEGANGIVVEGGGVLRVLNGSKITAYNPSRPFLFYVKEGSVFEMRDSELSFCGSGLYDLDRFLSGLTLFTDHVVIENCQITNCSEGITCYASFVTIANCVICNNSGNGIFCGSTAHYVSITNCTLAYNEIGVTVLDTSFISIYGCRVHHNERGIYCVAESSYSTRYVNITDCQVAYNDYGVSCTQVCNISICYSLFSNNEIAIHAESCLSLHIESNRFENDSIQLEGTELAHFTHYIAKNTVNDKPLLYIVNSSNIQVTSEIGQLIVVGSTNVTVRNQTIASTDLAIELAFTNSSLILGNNLASTRINALCIHCHFLTFCNCSVSNGTYGIYCTYCSHLWVKSCTVQNNQYGIFCRNSQHITLQDSLIAYNEQGISCSNTPYLNVTWSTIRANIWGIRLSGLLFAFNIAHIHYCNIYSNQQHGLYVGYGYSVEAANNWWGSPDGPEYKEEGDPRDPEEIYSQSPKLLTYSPWLKEPAAPAKPRRPTLYLPLSPYSIYLIAGSLLAIALFFLIRRYQVREI